MPGVFKNSVPSDNSSAVIALYSVFGIWFFAAAFRSLFSAFCRSKSAFWSATIICWFSDMLSNSLREDLPSRPKPRITGVWPLKIRLSAAFLIAGYGLESMLKSSFERLCSCWRAKRASNDFLSIYSFATGSCNHFISRISLCEGSSLCIRIAIAAFTSSIVPTHSNGFCSPSPHSCIK